MTTSEARERHQLLNIRLQMIGRCHDPKHPCFKDYGARGITLCQAWRESAEVFLADIGPRPKGLTLDRRENERGYEPGNVRWATRAEQVRNKRDNIHVEVDGQSMVLADACALRGLHYDTIWNRIKRGVPADVALARPIQKPVLTPQLAAHIRSEIAAGKRQCDIARALGVNPNAVGDVCRGKSYLTT